MSLPARERWALGAIEGALEASEPRMGKKHDGGAHANHA
jgi:hypothetical protein